MPYRLVYLNSQTHRLVQLRLDPNQEGEFYGDLRDGAYVLSLAVKLLGINCIVSRPPERVSTLSTFKNSLLYVPKIDKFFAGIMAFASRCRSAIELKCILGYSYPVRLQYLTLS